MNGDFRMLLEDDEQVYAFTRRLGDTELLVVANFSGEPAAADVPDAERWAGAELVITNGDPAPAGLGLGPWEARVYRATAARSA